MIKLVASILLYQSLFNPVPNKPKEVFNKSYTLSMPEENTNI